MKKYQIHQFDPIIYPRYLWVVVDPLMSDITDRFDIDETLPKWINENRLQCGGIGMHAVEKETRIQGIIMMIAPKISVGSIAHEAAHIADYIFEEIGAYSQDFKEKNEPYAYLVGWAADCIYKTIKNKT